MARIPGAGEPALGGDEQSLTVQSQARSGSPVSPQAAGDVRLSAKTPRRKEGCMHVGDSRAPDGEIAPAHGPYMQGR